MRLRFLYKYLKLILIIAMMGGLHEVIDVYLHFRSFCLQTTKYANFIARNADIFKMKYLFIWKFEIWRAKHVVGYTNQKRFCQESLWWWSVCKEQNIVVRHRHFTLSFRLEPFVCFWFTDFDMTQFCINFCLLISLWIIAPTYANKVRIGKIKQYFST